MAFSQMQNGCSYCYDTVELCIYELHACISDALCAPFLLN